MTTPPHPETCTHCHRPERQAWLCPTCTGQLRKWLHELAGHAADLQEVVITRRTSRRGERVQVRGEGEQPLIVDLDAAESAWELHSDLVAIVRDLCESRAVEYTGVDTSAALARWLAHRVESLALDPSAQETFDVLEHRTRETRKVVDIPVERVLVGPCSATLEGIRCGHDIRARAGETSVRCPACMTVHDVAELQGQVLRVMREQQATVVEIAGYLGRTINPGTLRSWVSRGRLVRRGQDWDGSDRYRVGDVIDLLDDRRHARLGA